MSPANTQDFLPRTTAQPTPSGLQRQCEVLPSRSPSQGDEDSALILTQDNLKSSDPDLSATSDQESGWEDPSCRFPSGGECVPSEDSGKDRDSYEAVFHRLRIPAWSSQVKDTQGTLSKIRNSAISNKNSPRNGTGRRKL